MPITVHEPRLYAHAPRPMLKSALHALEGLAPAMFAGVRATVFRSWQVPALLPDLVPRWMVHQGLARSHMLDPLHIASGDVEAPQQLAQLAGTVSAACRFSVSTIPATRPRTTTRACCAWPLPCSGCCRCHLHLNRVSVCLFGARLMRAAAMLSDSDARNSSK